MYCIAHRTGRLVAALTAIAAAAIAAPAAADAAPSWGCTATPLSGTPIDPTALRSNPTETPCVDDDRDILDVDLGTVVGLDADMLDSQTTTTDAGPLPDRTVTASAEVAGIGLGVGAFSNLLSVGTASSSVTASCPSAGAGVAPTLIADSTFADIQVLGVNVAVEDATVDIDIGLVRALIVPNYEVRTATSVRRAALHVEITLLAGGATLLVTDIADSSVSATDDPCGAPTSGEAPGVVATPGAANRAVSATATRASAAAHDALQSCTIAARPAGSSEAFVALDTAFDAAAGTCSASLDRARFPGPGDYEVRATATDADGDVGASAPIGLHVAVPAVGTPTLDGGSVVVPAQPAPGVPVVSCSVTLTPAAGGTPVDLGGTYDTATQRCTAALPTGLAPGDHTVTTVVVDANGDQGTGTATLTIPGTGGGGGNGDGTGGGGGAGPAGSATDQTTRAASGTFTTGTAADLALACTSRKLVLTDVQRSGRQVLVRGVAAAELRGQRVRVTLVANAKVVARPVVGSDGTFQARVAAPAARIARTNAARYIATAGRERSAALKLNRRMATASVTTANGTVTFSGRVEAPLARTRETVTLKRLVSCGKYQVVGRAKLDGKGRYRIRVPAPADVRAAVYRADVRVATREGGPARTRTYTLPLAVDLP